MRKLKDYQEHLGGCLIQSVGDMETEISGATCDSRQVRQGMLFCAMKGERTDGHDYIFQALEKGASAVLAERIEAIPDGVPGLIVKEPYSAFGLVAELANGLPAADMRFIGVTGTNGKTTTAWLLRAIAQEAGLVAGMVGTVEYDLGRGKVLEADRTTPTPFELQALFRQMRENGAKDVIMEVSSHALAQNRLGTTLFDCAVFTNLTRDHFDYHHDFENYYQCKKKLFTNHLKRNAPAVINLDSEWGQRLYGELADAPCRRVGFSCDGHTADVRVKIISQNLDGTNLEIVFRNGETWTIESPLTGHYNAENIAGAVVCAYECGWTKESVRRALASCAGAPGRLQRIPLGAQRPAVYVDYAHTDDAIRQALSALRKICGGRLGIVFGCGGNRDKAKRPLMLKAALECADRVFVTSDNPRFEEPEDIIRDIMAGTEPTDRISVNVDRKAAISQAIGELSAGDVLLVAGKGHEDYQEIKGVKHPFSDAEVIENYLP